MKKDEVENSTKSKKGGCLKKLKWVVFISAGIVLLIFFGTPLYLSSSGGTNLLLGKINQAVDGQVAMDDLSVGWFKGVKLTNLSYNDSAAGTAVKVSRIETRPKYTSLLGGKVKLGKTVIEKPQIHLKVQEAPTEAPAETTETVMKDTSPPSAPPVIPLEQIDLEVIDGMATIEVAGDPSQTLRFANIASTVQIAAADQPSAMQLSVDVNESAKITANGKVTPKKGWTLADGDFSVKVSKLQLESLKPLFAMAGQDMDMAGQLNADATIQVAGGKLGKLKADAQIDDFAQGTGEKRVAFKNPVKLSAATSGTGETMKIESLDIQSDFCKVACSGTLQSLNYDVDADLAQTTRFAGQFTDLQGLSAAGQLKAAGKVNLTDEQVAVVTEADIKQLVLQKNAVKTPATDAAMDINCVLDKAANQLKIAAMNLKATPGTVTVSNLAVPLTPEAPKNVSMDAQAKLDLEKVWPFAQILGDAPADMELAGMLDSTVKISTQGSQIQLKTDKTQIQNLKITRGENDPYQQEILNFTGDVLLDVDKQTIDTTNGLIIKDAKGKLIEVSKIHISKTVNGKNTQVKGNLEAAYDLKTVSAFAGAYLPKGLVLEGQRNDNLKFDSTYPTDTPELLTQNLNASGILGFDKASYQGLNFGPTELKLDIQKGMAAIDIPDADVNGGKVRFAGDINLAEEPMILRLRKPAKVVENVNVNEITAHILKYINPMFSGATNVSGLASLSCKSLEIPLGGETAKEDIKLDGAIGLTDVRLNSPLLGLFKEALKDQGFNLFSIPETPFTVKDEKVTYEDMAMMFGKDFGLHFGGTIGLDQSLDMTVKVPYKGKNYRTSLTGRLAQPKIDLSKLLMGALIQEIPVEDEKTKEAIEQGLEILDGIFNRKRD